MTPLISRLQSYREISHPKTVTRNNLLGLDRHEQTSTHVSCCFFVSKTGFSPFSRNVWIRNSSYYSVPLFLHIADFRQKKCCSLTVLVKKNWLNFSEQTLRTEVVLTPCKGIQVEYYVSYDLLLIGNRQWQMIVIMTSTMKSRTTDKNTQLKNLVNY